MCAALTLPLSELALDMHSERPAVPQASESGLLTRAATGEHRLPPPASTGGMPLHRAIAERRSHREFLNQPLSDDQISQLCWSAQGITSDSGDRAVPSAGALYPALLYVADNRGVFEYLPQGHRLRQRSSEDVRARLQRAALDQESVGSAPVCLIITFDPDQLSTKYGHRSSRYCWLESGHIAQNILLQATSLGLAGVPIGAFDDEDVARVIELPPRIQPAYLLPIGRPLGH